MSLAGQRVVVTRAAHQSDALSDLLRQHGAEVLPLPTVAIAPPLDPKPLQEAAARIADFDWLVFTSANAVRAFRAELSAHANLAMLKVAAVGTATAAAAGRAGFTVTTTPSAFTAEALFESMKSSILTGQRVLVPAAEVSRDVIASALRNAGVQVDVVTAYRNVTPDAASQNARRLLCPPYPDWITFASPSAFQHLLPLVSRKTLNYLRMASIGPTTTAAIQAAGVETVAEAEPHTAEGLLKVLLQQSR